MLPIKTLKKNKRNYLATFEYNLRSKRVRFRKITDNCNNNNDNYYNNYESYIKRTRRWKNHFGYDRYISDKSNIQIAKKSPKNNDNDKGCIVILEFTYPFINNDIVLVKSDNIGKDVNLYTNGKNSEKYIYIIETKENTHSKQTRSYWHQNSKFDNYQMEYYLANIFLEEYGYKFVRTRLFDVDKDYETQIKTIKTNAKKIENDSYVSNYNFY